MFENLKDVQRGETITADKFNKLVRVLRSMRLSVGPGLKANFTPQGTTLTAEKALGGAGDTPNLPRALVADIRSGGPFVYSADLSNGSVTDLVCVPVVTYFSAIPSGTRLLVFNAETETTGGYAP